MNATDIVAAGLVDVAHVTAAEVHAPCAVRTRRVGRRRPKPLAKHIRKGGCGVVLAEINQSKRLFNRR